MIPAVAVNIAVPPWVWWVALAIIATVDIVWNVYRVQAVLDQLDRATDDADKGARGVERHDGEIEEIRVYLAARDDADTDEIPAVRTDTTTAHPAASANVKIEALRPVPHRREGVA